ncbi:hypothetical protein HC766_04660, partial [Candidatus Gracilibacteria bacterium]|nr:hypothetical protein [Candidatus Gracilibacteria bacterium]
TSKIINPISTQAQSTPDWVPDFSSVNFFDMDEVGTWVDSSWVSSQGSSNAQPSVTFGNGRMYVAVRGTDNKVYVGNWNSNGDDFQGWSQIGNNWVTPDSPTIEWYWGRIYVGIRGTNNRTYLKWSGNGGASWTGWADIGGVINSGWDLERVGNSLYARARGTNNRLYLNRMDNGSNNWTGWVLKGGWSTIDKPVLAAHNNTLYFGIRGTDNKAYVNINGLSWSDNNWREVRNGTDESFGMASIGSRLCFLFRNPNNAVVQGCADDPNLPNRVFTINSNINSAYPPALAKDWQLMQVVVGGESDTNPGNGIKHRKLGFSTDSRGYITEMIWDNPDFGPNATYEHDIFLWNGNNPDQNNTTYLTKNTTPYQLQFPPKGCYPEVRYATSTLPSYYLDTRIEATINPFQLCDNATDEVSYTFGTSNPSQLSANKQYVNYWTSDKGIRK